MPDVTPEAKKAVEQAYATFREKLKAISHEHRVTVGELLTQLDQKHIEQLKKQVDSST